MPTTDPPQTDAGGEQTLGAAQRWSRGSVAVLFVTVLVVAYLWPASPLGGVTLCPFRRLTDFSCFGCGMTRAWTALLGGRWVEAVGYHPFAPVLMAGLGVWAARSGVEAVSGRAFAPEAFAACKRIEKPVVIGALLFVVIFGVVRFLLELSGAIQPI